MLQFAHHPLSSVLLCCTTLTDFGLLILKCEKPFLSINILDLFVCGRPCVSCFPYLSLFQNELCMFLGHLCLSLLIAGSIYYIGDTCNLLQAVVNPLLGPRLFAVSFSKRRFLIFWLSFFVILNIDIGSNVQTFSCIFIDYSCLVFYSFCMIKIL